MLEVIYVVLGCLGASEAFLTIKKRSNKDTRKSGKDRLTLASLWIVVSVSIFLSILFREMIGPNVPITVVTVGGLLMAISGSLLRWTAIKQLKEAFTVDVSIVSEHNLKTDGVYRYVRHPSYTGLLMNYVGVGIAMNNIYSFAVLSVTPYYCCLVQDQRRGKTIDLRIW